MPLYEYRCLACEAEFECLVRDRVAPACPSCTSGNLERLLTSFAVSSADRSQRALASARASYRHSRERTDRLRHEAEEIRDHLQQDYGVETGKVPPKAVK